MEIVQSAFTGKRSQRSWRGILRSPKPIIWPDGALALPWGTKIISLINILRDHIYVSLFGGIQAAAATALTSPQDCVKALVARYQSRRDVFYSALSEIGWEAQNQLAPFQLVPVPKGFTSVSFADLFA